MVVIGVRDDGWRQLVFSLFVSVVLECLGFEREHRFRRVLCMRDER